MHIFVKCSWEGVFFICSYFFSLESLDMAKHFWKAGLSLTHSFLFYNIAKGSVFTKFKGLNLLITFVSALMIKVYALVWNTVHRPMSYISQCNLFLCYYNFYIQFFFNKWNLHVPVMITQAKIWMKMQINKIQFILPFTFCANSNFILFCNNKKRIIRYSVAFCISVSRYTLYWHKYR